MARLTPEQLPRHLTRGLSPLYTVFGAEPLLALEAADGIRGCARAAGYTEREVLIAESGFQWAALRHSAQSLSLFGSRRVLELLVPTGKPGAEGAAAMEALARNLPPDTVTLILLPDIDWRTAKAAWFTSLEGAGVTVAANPVPRQDVPRWIAGRLEAQGQRADPQTLQFIADRVEGNLLGARQEVQKLGLLFPPGELPFDAVRDAVLDVARYDAYKLGEALFSGDLPYLLRMLKGLETEGVAAPLALWSIAEEVRTVTRVGSQLAAGEREQGALKAARVWGPRQVWVAKAARRIPLRSLEDALLRAGEIDRMVKGLQRGDPWIELTRLAVDLARAAATSSGSGGSRPRVQAG